MVMYRAAMTDLVKNEGFGTCPVVNIFRPPAQRQLLRLCAIRRYYALLSTPDLFYAPATEYCRGLRSQLGELHRENGRKEAEDRRCARAPVGLRPEAVVRRGQWSHARAPPTPPQFKGCLGDVCLVDQGPTLIPDRSPTCSARSPGPERPNKGSARAVNKGRDPVSLVRDQPRKTLTGLERFGALHHGPPSQGAY